MIARSIITDCTLVVGKVSIAGGVEYRQKNQRKLEATEQVKDRREWETIRDCYDPDELAEGIRIVSYWRRKLSEIGCKTDIGTVVPEAMKDEIQKWHDSAYEAVRAYNANALHSRLSVSIAVFDVRSNNERAAAMIAEDLRDLLGKMEKAVNDVDPPGIREVAKRLNGFKDVVIKDLKGPIAEVIDKMRDGASVMVETLRDTEGDWEEARSRVSLASIEMARFALDEYAPEGENERLPPIFGGVIEMSDV